MCLWTDKKGWSTEVIIQYNWCSERPRGRPTCRRRVSSALTRSNLCFTDCCCAFSRARHRAASPGSSGGAPGSGAAIGYCCPGPPWETDEGKGRPRRRETGCHGAPSWRKKKIKLNAIRENGRVGGPVRRSRCLTRTRARTPPDGGRRIPKPKCCCTLTRWRKRSGKVIKDRVMCASRIASPALLLRKMPQAFQPLVALASDPDR